MRLKKYIDDLWEIPIFYKLLQATLAGGGHSLIKKYLLKQIPKSAKSILDQGCGTGEYSLLFGDRYTGVDISKDYIVNAKKKYPGQFFVGSALDMKLKDNSFDVVFAVGLHHHLTDSQARYAVREALRVTKKGGKYVIIDAMLPKLPYNLPGLFLRKMDRGGNVRYFEHTLALIPEELKYKYEIFSSFPFDYLGIVIVKD
jgi:ubiquinone/menaquinone biosynthesis C-methylase UbiE